MAISMSKEGTYAWVLKAWVGLFLFWLAVGAIYSIMKLFEGYSQIIKGLPNSITFAILILTSMAVVAAMVAAVAEIVRRSIEMEMGPNLNVKTGLFGKSSLPVPYSQIKDVEIGHSILEFIDDAFGVCDIVIKWERRFTVAGVKDGRKIVGELNERIASSKKKAPSVDELMGEIKRLRSEIDELKSRKPERKEIPTVKEEKKRRGFGSGPLEEEM